jgi:hypothetical protein
MTSFNFMCNWETVPAIASPYAIATLYALYEVHRSRCKSNDPGINLALALFSIDALAKPH